MKLMEYKNEDAIDLLADIFEPVCEIMADPEIKELFENKAKAPEMVKSILKNHKKAIIEILARLDGVPVEEYKCNILSLPIKIIEILNEKELIDFFSSQVPTEEQKPFGGPMEAIKAKGE